MSYEVVIGLEVHAQLNTKSKLFSSSATNFDARPNENVSFGDLALPGTLPVMNEAALAKAILFGKAINAKINERSMFNRKNYFYADLPKSYQTSQFDVAIVEGGFLDIEVEDETKRINITRAHLEEDAGKLIHEGANSLLDLNRAGMVLLEIVSEPEIKSSDEAVAYLKKLHDVLRFLDISDANMQEGSFRCDVNISLNKPGQGFGDRVEIKNLNSFRFVQEAIEYERKRQGALLDKGESVAQETRLFDTQKMQTKSMRSKEDAADYRYFLDPDICPIIAPKHLLEQELPELREAKIKRYCDVLGLKKDDAIILTSSLAMSRFFEFLLLEGRGAKLAANWLNIELLGLLTGDLNIENCPISKESFSTLLGKIESKELSNKAAKDVLAALFTRPDVNIDSLIDKLGLRQVSDEGAIKACIEKVLAANEQKVAEYKSGKDKLFGFFVGQVMKEGKGAFAPDTVNRLLKELL